MNTLMIFFGFLLVLSGVAFVTHELLHNASTQRRGNYSGVIFIFIVLVLVLGVCGIYTALRRETKNIYTACYAISLFLLLVIPLLAEGAAILELDALDMEEVNLMCKQNIT